MTLTELKKEVDERDVTTLDLLLSMYNDLYHNPDHDVVCEIGLYINMMTEKYGNEFMVKFRSTDEFIEAAKIEA